MRSGLSKRSLAFTFLGVFFILQGVRIYGEAVSDPDLAIAHELYLPIGLRVCLWTVSGLLVVLYAWAGPRRQWISSAAAVVMPAERTLSYLFSFIHWTLPGPPGGSPWSIVDAARWGAILGLLLVLAGWVEWDRGGGEGGADES